MEYAPHLIWETATGKKLLYVRTKYSERVVEQHLAGKVDAKGRKEGYAVKRFTIDYIAPEEGHTCGQIVSIEHGYGLFYAVRIQKQKDGIDFGATQGPEEFRTEAEREAFIAKTLKKRLG